MLPRPRPFTSTQGLDQSLVEGDRKAGSMDGSQHRSRDTMTCAPSRNSILSLFQGWGTKRTSNGGHRTAHPLQSPCTSKTTQGAISPWLAIIADFARKGRIAFSIFQVPAQMSPLPESLEEEVLPTLFINHIPPPSPQPPFLYNFRDCLLITFYVQCSVLSTGSELGASKFEDK